MIHLFVKLLDSFVDVRADYCAVFFLFTLNFEAELPARLKGVQLEKLLKRAK